MADPVSLGAEILAGVSLVANAVQFALGYRATARHNRQITALERAKVSADAERVKLEARLAAVEEQRAKNEETTALVRNALELVGAEREAKADAVKARGLCEERVDALTVEVTSLKVEIVKLREVVEMTSLQDRQDP